jgi:addiction module HigA family antidote
LRAIHPGEILKGELEELNLSANTFAKVLHVPTNRITAILKGQRGITADTALRLAQFFGSTPDFWMSLQSSYDVKVASAIAGKDIEKNVKARDWVKNVTSMIRIDQ